uniref:Uncharacterized protein n=1 Tax=Setaria italica TaxID=4555 RepID=K3Z1P7_SETIT
MEWMQKLLEEYCPSRTNFFHDSGGGGSCWWW